MTVQMTEDQLTRLLASLSAGQQPPITQGSFARCTARYDGSKDRNKLNDFITTTTIYKDIEGITDANALKGLPLLLEGEAATWWQGVQHKVTTWTKATELMRIAFAPKKPSYQIYAEIFGTKQEQSSSTDSFIAQKRALLAELTHAHPEEVQLDMVYSLLKLQIRKKVPRDSVETFDQLIDKARALEEIEKEIQGLQQHKKTAAEPKKEQREELRPRCAHCRIRGHTAEECRRRKVESSSQPPTLRCYGCGTPGYVRSKCPTCNKATTNLGEITFCALNTDYSRNRPVIPLTIKGNRGCGFLDTGAKTSVASSSLYNILRTAGEEFTSQRMQITLADGFPRHQVVLTCRTMVQVADRKFLTNFIVLPDSKDNRTLLGIDFLENAGIVINAPQRTWCFVDQPGVQRPCEPEPPIVPVPAPVECEKPRREESSTHVAEVAITQPLRTPRKRERETEGELIDQLFDRCFSHFATTEIASINVTLRPEEATAISEEQRRSLTSLLEDQGDLFKESGAPTPYAEHRIDTSDHGPIAVPPYRLSPPQQLALKKELQTMIKDEIIEECDSPWAAPVVLVKKKDGGVRVCVDYRKLNAITTTDCYPLPRMDDLLHAAKRTPCMSTLDLRAGYWQIPVRFEDRDKTAFVTPSGTFRFLRMPFGLRNAPATFQRLMDRLRTGLGERNVLAYLDDLIVLSPDFEAHLDDLKAVFTRIGQFGLRMNRQKCFFCCPQVKYLGHILTAQGIQPDPEKTAAIQNLPAPRNLKTLLSFIQTCSWYRRFISNFATVAEPLTRLTKKKATWTWGSEQAEAFEKLKEKLTNEPILQQADMHKPYTLRTDASGYALGGVLLQGEKENEHPVEYASRLLTPAERNYSTTEREALAVVWAVNKFRGYIEGSEVTIASDHQPLRWLMTLKSPSGRLARWALVLQSFNLRIQYIPGKSNTLADLLSRPSPQPDDLSETTSDLGIVSVDLPTRGAAETRKQQLRDEEIRDIIACFEGQNDDAAFARWTARGYIMANGVLYRFHPEAETEEAQLVVPAHERKEILRAYHDDPTAGHYGVERTLRKIRDRYFWPGMYRDVAAHIKACAACQRYKPANLKPAGLVQTPAMRQRFEVISIDLFGPLPETEEGLRWILIVEDTATRWVELFALRQATADSCARVLLDEVFLRYGVPRRIISDNGTQFVSGVMQYLLHCLNIDQIFTPVYHPEANPVERKNRDLKTQLAILVGDNHPSWAEKIPAVRFAMNSTPCSSTDRTAAYLTFGRELRSPDEVSRDLRAIVQAENLVHEITPRLVQLAETLQTARETQERQQDRHKAQADTRRRAGPHLQPGDLVWVTNHLLSRASQRFSSKLAPRRDGPYVILQQRGATSYEVAAREHPTTPVGTYHASALTPYHATDDEPPAPINPIRKRGRPRKNQTLPPPQSSISAPTITNSVPLAGTSSGPEGEPVA